MLNKKEEFRLDFIMLVMAEFTVNNLDLKIDLFNDKSYLKYKVIINYFI